MDEHSLRENLERVQRHLQYAALQNSRLLRYVNRLENFIIDSGVFTSIVAFSDQIDYERDAAGLQPGDIPDD